MTRKCGQAWYSYFRGSVGYLDSGSPAFPVGEVQRTSHEEFSAIVPLETNLIVSSDGQ